jgi:hypothetical protein
MKFTYNIKKYLLILFAALLYGCSSADFPDNESKYQAFAPDGIPFVVLDSAWNVDMTGNHRAVVSVADGTTGNAVRVTLPWRRPDIEPETKRVVVKDAAFNKEITNVSVISLSAEKGEIVFQPESNHGTYYIYYLPYKFRHRWGITRHGISNDYLPPEYAADPEWEKAVKENIASLPEATVMRFETRSKRDAFTPMGLIATESEIKALKDKHSESFVLFPEDRAFPICLKTLPARWASKPYNKGFQPLAQPLVFEGYALPNEYYTWQIGLWASKKSVEHAHLTFSDFKHSSGKEIIPASAITCFNQEGINWDGKLITFDINVPENKIQALWCGLQIPETIRGGKYTGNITVSADGAEPQIVDVLIHTGKDVLVDKGDGDLWRHSRLRWLNSTIGMDSLPISPYEKIQINDNQITATGKTVLVGKNGLPQSIEINNQKILAEPVSFVVETGNGTISFAATDVQIKQTADGLVRWTASSEQNGLNFACEAYMEFDGYLRYNIKLSSDREMQVKDIRLETPYTAEASEYFMGIGHKGGNCPVNYSWNWEGPYDSYWIGGTQAGLHVEFRGGAYHGPLLNEYKPAPPQTWANDGKGTIRLNGRTSVVASTGSRTVSNVPLDFEFALLVTPVKPLNLAKHFSEKYYHTYHTDEETFAKGMKDGANVINIHHAQTLNPYINYPFIVREPLKEFIREQHEQNRKVKLYYTIRELATHAEEIHALKSLNHEIYVSGPGYGLSWYSEHLIADYKTAYYAELPGQQHDAALALNGFSRWINYYLEGLRWMFENYDIDGIYMDDVSFDRDVMKRMRRIMAQYHPSGALIDLHSEAGYSCGPANQYTGFFPYLDKLWFGESFQYNSMTPDEWFVTFSGIPFGVMSEMLQGGGNRFLGMVYGATARHSWDVERGSSPGNKPSPAPVWKLWESFGIEEAEMIGYWDKACPVKTNHPNVKATTYVRKGKTLISIGNFDTKDKQVRLSFDWEKLGLDPEKAILEAPFVADFQQEQTFRPDEMISVKSKEGWLLILKNKSK